MRKTFLILLILFATRSTVSAQDSFYPGWYYGVKAGVAYTAGQSNAFGQLISPSALLSSGYNFLPAIGVRADLSGWQGKGVVPSTSQAYKYNFVQLGVDAVWDICNTFKYDPDRILSPYIFGGLGLNYRFNNKEARGFASVFPTSNHIWYGQVLALGGRAGAGVDLRLSDAVKLEFELTENILPDGFNSLADHKIDSHVSAMLGLKFAFGNAAKKNAALAAAEAEAARMAAEKAAAEKAAAEESSRIAAQKAAAEKAAAEAEAARNAAEKAKADQARIAAERAAARSVTEKLQYDSEQARLNGSHDNSIRHIVDVLNAYPEAVVTVTGYADKETGVPSYNLDLSKRRAENVAKALKKAGIAEERIEVKYVGDTEAVSPVSKENRAVVCVTR